LESILCKVLSLFVIESMNFRLELGKTELAAKSQELEVQSSLIAKYEEEIQHLKLQVLQSDMAIWLSPCLVVVHYLPCIT